MKFYRIADLPRWLRDVGPLLLVMSGIYWLSSRSVLVVVEGPVREKLFFKSAHLIAYAMLAWCWWRALAPQHKTRWPVLLAALGLTILYGVSDEIHQLFVPGRHGQVADVLFDAAGALLMILLIRHLTWLRAFPEGRHLSKNEGKSTEIVSSPQRIADFRAE